MKTLTSKVATTTAKAEAQAKISYGYCGKMRKGIEYNDENENENGN